MNALLGLVDAVMDRSLVLGYTRIGYRLRRNWWPADPVPGALTGKAVLITGGTSGIGKAAARRCAELGATVHLVGRDAERGQQAVDELERAVPTGKFVLEHCDLGSSAAVRAFADDFGHRVPALHALVHNAGTMAPERTETAEGHEVTLATHVLGPFLLTSLLRPTLRDAPAPRIVFMSSGGMYGQPLRDDDPEYRDGDYSGPGAYARTKRMQVVLAEMWADEVVRDGIAVHSMHPGWVDTPGVRKYLPRFRALTRLVIRTPAEGADTMVWLVATDAAQEHPGQFWHDRAPRPTHYLRRTRENAGQRARLWKFCSDAVGHAP
ncbi:MAG TPA: SDR family NAD(P)-dependent oxidoreductase [Nocardioidaceae bacterium]|nr:SDR family NAD(P)-dependent oxidoreductase [Nocardioidaceae bacterium]